MRLKISLLKSIFFAIITGLFISCGTHRKPSFELTLHKNWAIQSSDSVDATGDQIASANFDTENWFKTQVPTTVLGALVHDSVYKDIFYGQNLKNIPEEPFTVPWWYRTAFNIPESVQSENTVNLIFDGLNFRGDIWLNGKRIARSDTTEGSFSRFSIDVSDVANVGGMNYLAVKITRPEPGEPRLGFVDWNPTPPDHSMGIWRQVHVRVSGPVAISHPFVKSDVDVATLDHADLTVSAHVKNYSSDVITGTLNGQIETRKFSQQVTLQPGESKLVTFDPKNFNELSIDHPRLWWTHEMGSPELYHLDMNFKIDEQLSDELDQSFGIREVTDYVTDEGHRGYKLNGKKILIKGGGWTDQMLLDNTPENLEAQVAYAKHMNLNTLRLEGFWGSSSKLYDLCDKNGILIMVGYSAQWEWDGVYGSKADEYGGIKSLHDMNLAASMLKDQVIWLRNHPSVFLWVYGSDKTPRPALEKKYLDILNQYDPTRPYAAAAQEHDSKVTGPTRMKMRGPYDYVPPDYWYIDDQYGGAFGFNTETGPGPVIPPIEGLKKFIPADSLWPINDIWIYHSSRGQFKNLDRYNKAMNQRLGKPQTLQDYERKAQYMNYEGLRAMFEAFEANRFKSTGIIQWMYNSAWPKLWWQLYGYYLIPNGGFYGTQKACEPVHIQYNYKTNAIDLINNTLKDVNGLKARVRVFNFDMSKQYDQTVDADIAQNISKQIQALPDIDGLSKTYFLDMSLMDKSGNTISSNFYTLSTQKDLLIPEKSTWYMTPQKQFADKTMLNSLPNVNLQVSHEFSLDARKQNVKVTLKNPGDNLAFMVRLKLVRSGDGEMVVPIFWDDNYISLLPGEERTIEGYCLKKDLNGQQPELKVEGWNISN